MELRPRFEGANIGTWIGFKHVMYLVEEGVLEHLRRNGLGSRSLYEERGLGVELVDSDVRILHALRLDDVVRCRVVPESPDGGELRFTVTSYVDRPDAGTTGPVKAVSARVRVVLRRHAGAGPLPPGLAALAVPEIARAAASGAGPSGGGFVWRWRVPYFYCHFSERLQHSGYVRLMEEVVDLFLADRGISIRTMLAGKQWIPVVPQARVEVLGEALMEEELHTVFTVEEVFKDVTYTARMDCSVRRDGRLVPAATGRITHGYAEVVGPQWRLVRFDRPTSAALGGNGNGGANGRGGAA